jgi:MSHA pilin protein MshD
MCTERGRQSGLSLIELVIFIVVVSVALVGILTVMDITTKSSADPQVRKQAIAIAESLLEEVMLKEHTNPSGGYTGTDRSQFDDVDDYNGYAATPAVDVNGAVLPTTGTFSESVSVTATPWGGLSDDPKLITVTVNGGGETISVSAYRAKF